MGVFYPARTERYKPAFHGIHSSIPTNQEVIASKVMGKGVIKFADGEIRLIVIFQLSNFYNFFFIFRAKSGRSPRKSWKLITWKSIYHARHWDLDDAIEYEVGSRREGVVITKRYPVGKRELASITERVAHPKYSTPTALPVGQSTDLLCKRLDMKIKGRPNSYYSKG